jgi:hypothetical protein
MAVRALEMNKEQQRQHILDRVNDWAGGTAQAIDWYENTHISALGCTAKQAVGEGYFEAVIAYLEGIAFGGYA